VGWTGGDEFLKGADGLVFFTVCPLAVCEQNHPAGTGRGVGVFGGEFLERSEIIRFGKFRTGGLLATRFDASIDNDGDGSEDEKHRKHGDSLLVPVKEGLEGVRLLGNLREWDVGFLWVDWHEWNIAKPRRPIKAASVSKSMLKSGSFTIFEMMRFCENGKVIFDGQPEAVDLRSRQMSKRVYVVAGELSGDAHGAGMLRALRERAPGLEIRGVGGPETAEVAGDGLRDWVEDAAVMGVWEVLKRYGWFKERFGEMLADLKNWQPDVLVLIDYPGFNLRFAKAVKRDCPRTKIVYYISPQVWAWHKGRIPKMVRILDEMLCLFPFEQPIFQNAGLKTTFVGHPLVDELEGKRLADVERDDRLVGLFPGSREREIARLFPMMIESAKRLRAWQADLRFEVPAASPRLAGQIRELMAEAGAVGLIEVNTGSSHSLMQRACCAVIASGTATLEAAYYGLPYCLVYRTAPLTYFLAKLLVKIRYIGLVNILAGEGVVEELIQSAAEPVAVAASLQGFLENPAKRVALQTRLAETADKLGGRGAHERAAEAVAGWL
jgi:lipid-A-disaccharide synthase